ncbi:MAG: alpha-amylase family glycosyl hydrolase [Bacilli bacterium]
MKKKKLFIGLSFILLSLLVLPTSNSKNNYEEILPDPVHYEDVQPINYELGTDVYNEGETDSITYPHRVIIHYHNDDGKNISRRIYTWVTNIDGVETAAVEISTNGQDSKFVIDLDNDFPEYKTTSELMFIIKYGGTWSGQSLDTSLPYDMFPLDGNGDLEVWTIPGESNSIEIYQTEAETKFDKALTAEFTDWKTISVTATSVPSVYRLYAFDQLYLSYDPNIQKREKENRLFKVGYPTSETFTISLNYSSHINIKYVLETEYESSPGRISTKSVAFYPMYDTPMFEEYYTYTGDDLGVTYTKEKSTFALWAPTGANVKLRIYSTGTPTSISDKGSNYFKEYKMYFQKGGVFKAEILGDLNGKYYTYYIENFAGAFEVIDPYAHGAGINGLRGLIYDSSLTNPDGWDEIPEVWDGDSTFDIASANDLTVYEVHIRDLTMDETWGGKEKPGTYNAFVEKGTTYTDNITTVTTGFDHIEELGVTAVQLLPVFDHDDDETNMKFNWGYNPLNYNVIEGGYSSDPYNGFTRIEEFKNLVMQFANNENHTRVIMDVVYNHVSSVSNCNFNKIMPRYYFRMDESGNFADGSGCANEVRTESTMMSKFIVDSVCWWAKEYKIKGFRFDLMGLIDTETMRKVKDSLYEIDKDIVVYGEGWTAAGYHGKTGTVGTTTAEVYSSLYPSKTSPGILGAFNDFGRNNTKGGNDGGYGSNNAYPGYGYISQGSEHVGDKANCVSRMMMGINDYANGAANNKQTVNYVSCHDNFTLFDQLNYTLSENPGNKPAASKEPDPSVIAKASLACHSAIFASQSIAFMQGGEELFRTKIQDNPDARPYPDYPVYTGDPEDILCTGDVEMFGKIISHNSYKSSDNCNSFKWDRKISIEYQGNKVDVSSYSNRFKEAIKIRNDKTIPQYLYPNNLDSQNISTWGVDSGSSIFGIRMGFYCMFFSGRSSGTISYDAISTCTIIYNSLGGTNGITKGSGTIKLEPYQFIITKF